jgi:hypothetical protein
MIHDFRYKITYRQVSPVDEQIVAVLFSVGRQSIGQNGYRCRSKASPKDVYYLSAHRRLTEYNSFVRVKDIRYPTLRTVDHHSEFQESRSVPPY